MGKIYSHSNLKFTGFCDVLDTFERLVFFAVHIEPVHLKSRHSELIDGKVYLENKEIDLYYKLRIFWQYTFLADKNNERSH